MVFVVFATATTCSSAPEEATLPMTVPALSAESVISVSNAP